MRKTLFGAAALAVGATFALTSCQSDDFAQEQESGGRHVRMSVSLGFNPDETRTTLTEVDGSLKCTWNDGDKVWVMDTEGKKLGELTILEGYDGKDSAKFDGDLIINDPNMSQVTFVYFGSNVTPEEIETANGTRWTFDYTSQEGTLASLSYQDFLWNTTDIEIMGSTAYTEDMGLKRMISFAHFELKFPDGVKRTNEPVTVSGEGVKGRYSLKKIPATSLLGDEPITVGGSGNDFYMTVIPNTITPTFSVTIDGKTYTGSLAERTWKASEFVRLSHGVGVPVEMTTESSAVDHSKNPLNKWAEADLVYNKTTKTSSIASSYTVQGSLYQWGRNPGFSDFKDAMGGYQTAGNRRYWEYATYGKSYYTGTGHINWNSDISDYSYDDNSAFSDVDIFFMNPNSTDYWVGNGGGNTWSERAKLCGYTTDVCPAGYRIPTKADFLEIKPTDPISGSGSLASVLSNQMEVKNNGECTYAIRWSAQTISNKTYLRIDALVVPDGFTTSQLSSINWTSDENVVTRYFGANGCINAFYHVNIVSNYTFPVARPMPSVEVHYDQLVQNGYGSFSVLWQKITDVSVNNIGNFWMADDKSVFTFQDNTRVKTVRKFNTSTGQQTGSYAFPNYMSVLGFLPTNAQNACSIRCVKAE